MSMYEAVLAKEFKKMMNERRSENSRKGREYNVYQIETPDLDLISPDMCVEDGDYALVKGIMEPYFSLLNSSCKSCPHYRNGRCSENKSVNSCSRKIVEISHKRVFDKKIAMRESDGSSTYRKNADGSYMTKEFKLDPKSVAIYSPINIHLQNKVDDGNGNFKEVKLTKGYAFIDAVETSIGTRYIYSVPKESVCRLNLCALVISDRPHRARYKGCKVALSVGKYVYIYSIPYKYRKNEWYKVLGFKADPDFDAETLKLLKFWMQKEIIFDLNLCSLSSNVGGSINLGIEDIAGSYFREDYVRTNGPLVEIPESFSENSTSMFDED